MSIVLQSSGGGSITVQEPATASNFTQTLPTANGTLATIEQIANGFRNRIINGDMRIDQRNSGASVTPASGAYTLDRWTVGATQASKFSVQQNAGAVTPPAGFTNYLGITSLSSYSVGSTDLFLVQQIIEGFNIADLGYGSASAQTVTLSFWIRSSLTGTFGGSLFGASGTRSYPFTYTINSANTWEQKTITIPGSTSGTWLTTNGAGLQVVFSLGAGSLYSGTAGAWANGSFTSATGATSVVGTNGATFYITGVQLEAGSSATPFDRRSYGTELALCQRYYWKSTADISAVGSGVFANSTIANIYVKYPQAMRASPTFNQSSTLINNGVSSTAVTSLQATYANINSALVQPLFSSSASGTQGAIWLTNGSGFVEASVEL